MIADTHIHLNDEKYDHIIEEVLERAANNNVLLMYIIGCDKNSSLKAIEICDKYNGYKNIEMYPIVGLHPSDVNKEEDLELKWLVDLIETKNILALGEIGIDLYWEQDNKDLQIQMFKKQLDIAQKYNLNVSIHSREAIQLTYDILKEYNNVKGVIHCYSGSVEMAREFIKLGYKLGIGGVLTYKNSKLYQVIEEFDLSNFVTETDGPYLSPVPYRGKTNEPSYLVEVINKIAELKGLTCEETEEVLLRNAFEVFNLEG